MASKRTVLATLSAMLMLPALLAVPAAAQTEDSTTSTSGQTETTEAAPTTDVAETPESTSTSTPSNDGSGSQPTAESATADQSTAQAPAQIIAKRGDRGSAVRDLQSRLAAAGFNPGVIDGIFGRRTQSALVAFQQAAGLDPSGIHDTVSADRLSTYTPSATPSPPTTSMSVREAQQRLVEAGFDPGPVDGLYGRRTRAGLEAFQRTTDIPVTGRIDLATIDALRNGVPATPNSSTEADTTATVRDIQRALAAGPFDPGPVDGLYGTKTKQAIWSLEKLAGLAANGEWSSTDADALQRVLNGQVGGPTTGHSRRWVEIDLSQQLMKVYDPGRTVPVLVSHVSSGSGIPWRNGRYSGRSITPTGTFTIFRRIRGWRQSSLGIGSLYNPLYFTRSGIALHGSRSVPSYPASHGCVRVPMHIAEYLPSMLPNGTPVVVTP